MFDLEQYCDFERSLILETILEDKFEQVKILIYDFFMDELDEDEFLEGMKAIVDKEGLEGYQYYLEELKDGSRE